MEYVLYFVMKDRKIDDLVVVFGVFQVMKLKEIKKKKVKYLDLEYGEYGMYVVKKIKELENIEEYGVCIDYGMYDVKNWCIYLY